MEDEKRIHSRGLDSRLGWAQTSYSRAGLRTAEAKTLGLHLRNKDSLPPTLLAWKAENWPWQVSYFGCL
jgi:hypothetical protein